METKSRKGAAIAAWLLLMAFAVVACIGYAILQIGDAMGPDHSAKNGSIGEKKEVLFKAVEYLRTQKTGRIYMSALPEHLSGKGITQISNFEDKAYAINFSSHPIDSDPIYIYVEADQKDIENLLYSIRTLAGAISQQTRKLKEPGWYYTSGQ